MVGTVSEHVKIIVDAIDNTSKPLNKIKNQVRGLEVYMNRLTKSMQTRPPTPEALRAYNEQMTKLQEKLSARTSIFRLAEETGIGVNRMKGALFRANLAIKKSGEIIDTATGKTVSYNTAVNRLRYTHQRFHMELLSVMFAGLMLHHAMTGLLRPAMQLTGVFDLWSNILALLFLPAAIMITDVLINILDRVSSLTDEQKRFLGIMVLVLAAVGFGLYIFGQLGLALAGIRQTMMAISGASKIANFSIMGLSLTSWKLWAILGLLVFIGLVIKRVMDKLGISVWDVVDAFAGFIAGIVSVVVPVLKWLWNNILNPIIEGLSDFIVWLIEVAKPVIDAIAWAIGSIAGWLGFGATPTKTTVTTPVATGAAPKSTQFNTYNVDTDLHVNLTGVEDPRDFMDKLGDIMHSEFTGRVLR